MNKISKNQKGFSAVEVLLVILILVVIGAVGYMIYHNDHKTKTVSVSTTASKTLTTRSTKSTTATANPYAGWKTYSGSQVSFQYPSDWTVNDSNNPQVGIYATSPIFTGSTAGVTDSSAFGSTISLLVQIGTLDGGNYCSGSSCQVTAVVPLSNSQLQNDVLAVVNQTTDGSNTTTYVVANDGTKVGDTTVNLASTSNSLYITGQPEYNSPSLATTVTAQVNDVTAFQADSHFTDLVSLLNSIKFN